MTNRLVSSPFLCGFVVHSVTFVDSLALWVDVVVLAVELHDLQLCFVLAV